MPARIRCTTDSAGVTLPNGWAMESGDEVIVADVVWTAIQRDQRLMTNLILVEKTTDSPTPVPSWRDIQRAAADWEVTPGGTPGQSAYQIAVANGFVGTEAQWIASLEGDPGTPGSPGSPGSPGAPGPSAYDIAVMEGFVGTQAEWLASLEGDPGAPGGDAESLFTFSSAATTWNCTHNLGKKYVDVVTVDLYDNLIEGEVDFLDDNTLTVNWYYPMSGIARVSP